MAKKQAEVLTFREQVDQLRGLVARSRRRLVVTAIVFGVGVIGAFTFALVRPRRYMSETQILYREGIRSADIAGGESFGDPTRKLAMRLQEMVLSRNRLSKIIDEFKLYPELVASRGYVDAVDEMRKQIRFRVKDGDNFYLSFQDSDPDRVQRVTMRLAQALIAENTRSKTQQAELTRDFLDSEMRRVEDEVRSREADLARFLQKHPEFARDTQGGAGAAMRVGARAPAPSKTTDPTLLALEREAQRLQERLGVATPKRANDGDPKLVAARADAESELNAAQKELTDRMSKYTEQHPDVVAAKARVKAAEARVKRTLDALVAGEKASKEKDKEDDAVGVIDRATLESQLAKINEEIRSYKARRAARGGDEAQPAANAASAVVAIETDWARLNRELAESRERLDKLQEKQFRAAMLDTVAQSGRAAQMEIVDEAYRPTHPAPPGRSLLALVGLIVAGLLAGGVTLLLAMLDDRLYYPNELERLGVGDVLGAVPSARRERRINRG